MQRLLLVGAGVVDRPDVVLIEADKADRFAQLVNERYEIARYGVSIEAFLQAILRGVRERTREPVHVPRQRVLEGP